MTTEFVTSLLCIFLFFKQKTSYELRISVWSSDVCSSDLGGADDLDLRIAGKHRRHQLAHQCGIVDHQNADPCHCLLLCLVLSRVARNEPRDRKSVVEGKRVSVSVDLGGRRIIKKKNNDGI